MNIYRNFIHNYQHLDAKCTSTSDIYPYNEILFSDAVRAIEATKTWRNLVCTAKQRKPI